MTNFSKQCLMLTLILALFCVVSVAQTSRGTVSGTVTDPNGAVIPGATVELKDNSTNQSRATSTNSSGIFRFDAVDLGTYDVIIKASGFKQLNRKGITVQANRISQLDTSLEVGTDTVTVDVNASTAELLQTSEPVLGGNFNSQTLTKLPVAGASAYDLARLLPGVSVPTGSGASFGNGTQVSVNGSRPRANNFLLDGVENNDISVTGAARSIDNEDAIQEVSVQTGLYSAEFGRAGGGVFNQITKSGTNDFRGTVRWLHQSDAFNATTNGQRLAGRTRPAVFTNNTYGGTIGGPVYFLNFGEGGDYIYNGKDRTFFFFSLQWDRFRSTANFGGTGFRVPTEAGFQALRALFPAGTNPRVDLYLNGIGSARGVTSFVNIPLGTGPNGAGATVARGNIQTGLIGISSPQVSDARQWIARIDHRVNDKHKLSFRFLDDRSVTTPSAMDSPFYIRDFQGKSPDFLMTHNWIISSSMTNEFRFSYGRIDFNFPISPGAPADASTRPNIAIAGLSSIGIATNIPQFRKAENFLYQDTFTKILGEHTFRMGAEWLKQKARQRPPFNERGSFSFTNQAGGFSALANYIDNFSGPSGTANINFGSPEYDPSLFRQSYYFQDTWRATTSLTLTMGLRYENFGQPANQAFRFPAFAGFDPANFLVPNKVNPDNNNFGPLLGLAYSPSYKSGFMGFLFGEKKSVIRTGYQISYDAFFNNLLSNIAADSPNNTATTTQAANTGRGNANFFPTAIPSTPRPPTVLDQQTAVFDPNIKNPYTQRWSLGFQRELPLNMFMDLSYVGSVGRKLFVSEDLNPLINGGARRFPTLGIRRQRASGANSDYHAMQLRVDKRLSNGFQVIGSYTFSKMMDQISEVFGTDSSSSALASVPVYQGGLKLDRAVSDYHRKNRLSIAYNWTLPGPKKGWASHLLGGWETSGVVSLQSGAPYTILNNLDRNGDGLTGADRPNLGNPNAPRNSRAVIVPVATCATGYRNPDTLACVSPTDVYVYQVAANSGLPGAATLGRNTERSNPVENVDMSFYKTFSFTERLKLEYRLEAFNIFNHPQFTGVPGRSIQSTLQGQFRNFDLITGGGRTMQMGLKVIF
jgi:hypothetical protein